MKKIVTKLITIMCTVALKGAAASKDPLHKDPLVLNDGTLFPLGQLAYFINLFPDNFTYPEVLVYLVERSVQPIEPDCGVYDYYDKYYDKDYFKNVQALVSLLHGDMSELRASEGALNDLREKLLKAGIAPSRQERAQRTDMLLKSWKDAAPSEKLTKQTKLAEFWSGPSPPDSEDSTLSPSSGQASSSDSQWRVVFESEEPIIGGELPPKETHVLYFLTNLFNLSQGIPSAPLTLDELQRRAHDYKFRLSDGDTISCYEVIWRLLNRKTESDSEVSAKLRYLCMVGVFLLEGRDPIVEVGSKR